jgi:hypothetical protein
MEHNLFIEQLKKELPPVFARQEVSRLTGGIISSSTLGNLDSLGKGPAGRLRIGKKIAYSRDLFVDWIASRTTIEK